MAPPVKPVVPPAAKPKFGDHFDAWNSSSTGHQRAENRLGGSIGWRQSRTTKLAYQFRSGGTGGKRVSDTVGAGSRDWDEKAKALISPAVRNRAETSVKDLLVSGTCASRQSINSVGMTKNDSPDGNNEIVAQKRGVFDGLVIYINGSTLPLISDHKLKHLLAENGAKLAISLGRRTVTHVILGKCNGSDTGAGGGLASSKIEKEIKRVGGCSVKYVSVEWVLDSIKQGKRMYETPYSHLKTAAKGQQSVYSMFKKADTV